MLGQARGQDGALVRAAAVQLLCSWAQGGVANCGAMATLGAGAVKLSSRCGHELQPVLMLSTVACATGARTTHLLRVTQPPYEQLGFCVQLSI